MISLTRLDGSQLILNADLIETVEATPDTIITFAHDKKVLVREKPEEVVLRVIAFRQRILANPGNLIADPALRPTPEQTSVAHKGTGRIHLLKQDEQPEASQED
ncbi:MAG TPA: flagellar FlbD family protein [Chloroflexota bacterium]|nr:flagellar FlbD family protein [Chloroflexota bacterium]